MNFLYRWVRWYWMLLLVDIATYDKVRVYTSSFFFGSRIGGSTSIPILAAVPAIILIADSIVVEFRSGSFSAAIERNWSMVTFPTFSCFGSLEPFSIPNTPHNIIELNYYYSKNDYHFLKKNGNKRLIEIILLYSINHNLVLTYSSLRTKFTRHVINYVLLQ